MGFEVFEFCLRFCVLKFCLDFEVGEGGEREIEMVRGENETRAEGEEEELEGEISKASREKRV